MPLVMVTVPPLTRSRPHESVEMSRFAVKVPPVISSTRRLSLTSPPTVTLLEKASVGPPEPLVFNA